MPPSDVHPAAHGRWKLVHTQRHLPYCVRLLSQAAAVLVERLGCERRSPLAHGPVASWHRGAWQVSPRGFVPALCRARGCGRPPLGIRTRDGARRTGQISLFSRVAASSRAESRAGRTPSCGRTLPFRSLANKTVPELLSCFVWERGEQRCACEANGLMRV